MVNRSNSRLGTLGLPLLPVALLAGLLAGCQDDGDDGKSSSPVIATISAGQGPIILAATDDSVWVELHREDRVARIEPQDNKPESPLPGVPVHCDIQAAEESVWATIHAQNLVTRFDAETGEVLQQVPIEGPCLMEVDGRSVWITSPDTGRLHRLVEGRDNPVESYDVGDAPFDMAATEDSMWITSEADGGVLRRFDLAAHEVTTVGAFPLVDTVVLASGYLWLLARDAGRIWKLDPSTGRVLDQSKLSLLPTGLVEHEELVWLTSQEGVLTSIDPETLEVVSDADLGHLTLGPPIFAFGSLWTSALDENLVLRVDVAQIHESTGR